MTSLSGERSGPRPAPLWLRLLTVVVALTAIVTLWSVSVPGTYFLIFMYMPTVWIVLAGLWLLGFGLEVLRRRPSARASSMLLLVMAVVVTLTAAAVMLDVPLRARFAASRPALDALAAELSAPDASATRRDRTVGLFDAERIERIDGGFRFLVRDSGFLDPVGFAYSIDGQPPVIGEDSYSPFDGPWWMWVESW